ncbi:MAG: ParB/RepB/Spo0J family partition protein [bacterium]|nr:ParB/RepB/Spo0J family partition protein [bacterium]
MTKVSISSIIVTSRVRTDLGNIIELAEDIKLHGLLHPVVINTQNELIAGYRRLKAVELLGWTEIPVSIQGTSTNDEILNTGIESQLESQSAMFLLSKLDMQLAENIKRKDLNPMEIAEAILERKHRFEQRYGPIQQGGDRKSPEYQKIKFTNGKFDTPSFYADTAKLLNKSEKYIYEFLQLNNLDTDLKQQVRNRSIGYRNALQQQAERNRMKRKQKKIQSELKSMYLPNREDIAPLQKQFQLAPNLLKLFILIQHSEQTIRQLPEEVLEYDKFELEYIFIFLRQLDTVIEYYQKVQHRLTLMQEQKITEFAPANKE